MRRPPNRKALAAALVLLVAAAVAFARPAVGVAPLAMFKQFVAPGGP
ncbi:MAG: hypothetical protein ACT4P3_19330 [Betaproteobacteria bacterium]